MDSIPSFGEFPIGLFVKGVVLLIIGLYLLFIFLAFIQVRALNRMVTITSGAESAIAQSIFFIYLLLVAPHYHFTATNC